MYNKLLVIATIMKVAIFQKQLIIKNPKSKFCKMGIYQYY